MAALDQETKGLLREYFSELMNERKQNHSPIHPFAGPSFRRGPSAGKLGGRMKIQKYLQEKKKREGENMPENQL